MDKVKWGLKRKDWSLNLEDEEYAEQPEMLLEAAVEAVAETGEGCYVNLVTPGLLGNPEEWLIARLTDRLTEEKVLFSRIIYVDECGCGGYVTRVVR